MSTRKVVLFDTQYLPAVETELYPVPSGMITTIDKFVAYNSDSAAAHVVTVLLVPPAEAPTGTEFIIERKTLQPRQTWLFPGIVGNMLNEDGGIRAFADAAGVVTCRAAGREDTTDL